MTARNAFNLTTQFALDINETADLIAATGHNRTIIVQGEMGWGKSALLNIIGAMPQFANYTSIYIDCTTKTDSGDFFMVKYSDHGQTFLTVPHEELGLHLDGPVILMFDEIGKMPRSAFNAVLRVLYERKYGNMQLHEESIVIATTNLAAEGIGDLLPPHGRNRCTVVTMKKSDQLGWLGWSIAAEVHHTVQAWAKDTPQLFYSFMDFESPELTEREAPHIYDPRAAAKPVAFVTGRSLEGASDIMHDRDAVLAAGGVFTDNMLRAALAGTIGPRAAADLMAYDTLMREVPTKDEIINDPMGARIPDKVSAVCMLVFRALATIDRSWAPQWMQYLSRLDRPAQGLFGNGTRVKDYPRLQHIVRCKEYMDWARDNAHLFGGK
jgi:hypothetical protein